MVSIKKTDVNVVLQDGVATCNNQFIATQKSVEIDQLTFYWADSLLYA